MTTIDILLDELSKNQKPGSMGHMIEVLRAIEVFAELRKAGLVMDVEASLEASNKRLEIIEAVLASPKIKAMREGGVIR